MGKAFYHNGFADSEVLLTLDTAAGLNVPLKASQWVKPSTGV